MKTKVGCPACKNTIGFKHLKPAYSRANNFLCLECGLVFIPRARNAMQLYYKRDGYFEKSPNLAYKKQFISKSLLVIESQKRIAGALDILPLDLVGKDVLDVGCGYGEILYCLKKKFRCRVIGVEASREAAKYGSELFSIPIHSVLFEEFSSKKQFDVIWCSHVLEHVSNPSAFLKKIKTLLKPQGYLYIEAPNILKPSGGFSLNMFLYGEHLQTFSPYNLYLVLKKNGFYTIAYSDSYFLKFWCGKSGRSIVPDKIIPREILSFLKKYRSEYGIEDYLRVYLRKILYGAKIVLYKARDVF